MPWKERSALEERKEFIKRWREADLPIAELCREFGISRQTEVDQDLYEVYFGSLLLGWFDSAELCFIADRVRRWHRQPAE